MFERWIIEGIENAIAIRIDSDHGRLVACGRLIFDHISNAIVVAVEIKVIGDAVAVGIDWIDIKFIPRSISIGISESGSRRFFNRNDAIAVSVGCDR